LPFILAIDSLSLHINRAVKHKKCKHIRICRRSNISHNLSVDDIMIFGMLCRMSWEYIHEILKKFQLASGIIINEGKSSFFSDEDDKEILDYLSNLFNIGAKPLKEGLLSS